MKKMLILIAVLVLASFAFAQIDVTIGTGTLTGRYPLNDYFVHSRSQCLYYESEIGNPGTIHQLRWFRNDTGANANAIGTTQIWVKAVSNAVLTGTDWEDPGTLVAEIANIDLGAGNGWLTVDIDDFVYTGGNLLVSVYTQNAPYTAPHSYWRYTTTTGINTCRLGNSDTVNPPTLSLSTSRPNIQINMTTTAPTVAPNPAVLISPANGSYALTGATLNWASGGGFPTSYDVYFGTSENPPFLLNQTATTYTPTLAAGTQYYWKVVPKNAFGDATGVSVWSFVTPTSTQIAESFEVAVPPAGWANGTTGNWTRSTSYAKHGTASAYKYGSTSVQYVLSTPRATITETSTLNLWTLASGTTGTLQVVYSPDRTTWTQIGATITHPVTYTWYNSIVDLSSLAGNNYYLGVRTGLQAVSYYTDMYIGPEITPEAPAAPVLSVPTDAAVNVNEYATFSWTAAATGGVPTGYRLYCDTNNPPTTLIVDQAALTYTLSNPLAYNTTYYWTVEAYNGAGTGPQAVVRSFTTRENPTILALPFTEGFETGNTDATAVSSWSNVYVTGTKNWTANSSATTYNRTPRTGSFNAFLGWSASTWMIRPVQLTGGISYDVELFARQDLVDVAYANMTVAYGTAGIASAMTNVIVPQTGLTNGDYQRLFGSFTPASTGIYYLGILGTLPTSTNWYVSIDDITIRETPAAPIFNLTPTSWDFGQKLINTTDTKQFAVSNNGGGTLVINSIGITGDYYSLASNPAPVSLTSGQTAIFAVQYAPTAVGTHNATVTINDSRVTTTADITGSCYDPTVSTFPFVESFDGTTFAPTGWTNIRTAGTSNPGIWDRVISGNYPTASPNSGEGMARYNMYSISAGGRAELITPPMNLPGDNYRVSFYMYRDTGYPAYVEGLNVYYNTTNSSVGGTLLGTIHRSTILEPVAPAAGWYNYTFNLPAGSGGNGRFIVFEGFSAFGNNMFLDDVVVSELPAGQPNPVTLNTPADGAINLPITGFNFSWTPANTGGIPTSWEIYLASNDEDITNDYLALYEPAGTSFNAVTEGGFTFDYSTRYYWAVNAINAEGSALSGIYWFETEEQPPVVSEFPYTVDFEAHADNTLPYGWTRSTLGTGALAGWQVGSDLGSDYWAVPAHTVYAASNDDAANTNSSMDLLVTPQLDFSGAHVGTPVLSFDSFYNGLYSQLAKVEISVDNNAWETLHTVAANADWTTVSVGLLDYAVGNNVKIRFHADDAGAWASGWAIDNVSIYYSTVDEIAPEITHLPLLNTPRTDIGYTVFADIADDTTWNNGISSANLFYSVNEGAYSMIPMAQDNRLGYYAVIPAQVLDSQVDYYIVAADASPAMNSTTSATYTFHVENPTWLWYDTGGTIFIGYDTVNFGPMVQFSNPYHGTNTAMQLLGSDGSSYYAITANLNVYTWDGVGDLVPVIAPVPVSFGAQTYHTFDLSSYNIQITTPYFFISYEDIPMNNYILFDETYDYGTSYVWQNGSLYTMARYGSWAIGANITSVQGAEAPVVSIANVGGVPVLSWDATAGMAYNVYAAADPYATDPWTLLTTTSAGTYSYTGTEGMRFFKVTSDSAPIRASVSGRTGSVNAPVITIKPNTQPTFNLKADREKK